MHGGDVWQGRAPGDWLDFSANTRAGGPPEWVIDALRAGVDEARYYPDLRMDAARRGLAAHLELDEACVLPTPGGVAALALAMGVGAKGALIPTPCFSEYAALAALAGLAVRTMPLSDLAGEAARLPEGWLICMGNPVNPLGRALEGTEIDALLDAAERANGWLMLDEAFVDYCPRRSARAKVATRGRLLVAGSMTKLLGIPGVRLGYLCARPDVLARLAKDQLPWALNSFAAAVACALPAHMDELGSEAALNDARRAAMRRALEALGARVYPSEAPFLLARFETSAATLAARLRARGILVRECMDFQGIDDDRHLRLAVKDAADWARLVEVLEEALACVENR